MDQGHDHAAPTHKMACPICGDDMMIHAHSDEEAAGLMMKAGELHFEAEHPDEEGMEAEEMVKYTKENIERVE